MNAGNVETTFGEFNEQVVCSEEVQGVMHRGDVVSERGAGTDDDVVHINVDDHSMQCMLVNKGMENMVHHCLECGR